MRLVLIVNHFNTLCIGGRDVFIRFSGIRSAFYLWINGQKVGYSQGSKTPAEFNISTYVKNGQNTISIEVYKFSDGSYLEGQDTWRLSGIERGVYVYSVPKTKVVDFNVHSGLDSSLKNGEFKLGVDLYSSEKIMANTLYLLYYQKKGKVEIVEQSLIQP